MRTTSLWSRFGQARVGRNISVGARSQGSGSIPAWAPPRIHRLRYPDGFATDSDVWFSEKIFNISVAQVEAVVAPDGITDDVGCESVAFVYIHIPIID